MKIKSVAVAALATLGFSGCERPDYYAGRRAGTVEVRKFRQEGGFGGEILINLIPVPVNADTSADWNAGYREGWTAELEKP